MQILNYTSLKRREKYVYSLFGAEIPGGGISVNLLICVGISEALFNMLGIFVSLKSGIPYIDFSTGRSYLAMFFIITPALIGFLIYKTKIKGHPLHIYIYYALKFTFSKKYKDIDGNSCSDIDIKNKLWVDENQ